MTGAALTASDIGRSYPQSGSGFKLLIEHVELLPGHRVAVTGPSGCGKSTILALLACALRPDEPAGALGLGGCDALALWRKGQADALAGLRANALGFVPQTAALLPFLSLLDNISLPLSLLRRAEPDRVKALTEQLGVAEVLARFPSQVSVGQRQRAAIARALVHRPSVVLADEPTASVHPAQADDILDLLTQASVQDGAALMMVTHDAERAVRAGYRLAPCVPETGSPTSRFAWPAG